MRLRMILHVFEGDPTPPTPHVEVWEAEIEGQQSNPLLLRKDGPDGGYIHLLSQERVEDGVAVYHPLATSPKLPLRDDLPKFGWERVERRQQS